MPVPPDSTARLRHRGSLLVASLLVVFAGTCQPKPEMPRRTPPLPGAFERPPYLQAVTDSSAVVRWRAAAADSGGELRYRVDGGPWRTAPAEHLPRGDHRVRLEGLGPGAAVAYSVREGPTTMGPYRFHTAPPPAGSTPARVLGFGDSGWGGDAQADLALLMRNEPWDLAVHVGDVAYDDGTEEELTLRHFRVYGELFAGVPFYSVPGNHDVRTANGAPYERAFDWPGEAEGRRYYTFRWGRTRFVALDTSEEPEEDELEDETGPQYRWLVDTLEEAARDTALDWTVVFTHYPVYSHGTGLSGHGPDEELREALEPLFLRYGVDLVLTGHEHHYERSRPLREGTVVKAGCGPVYMIIGGGGASRFARSVAPDVHTARVSREYHYVDLTFRRRSVAGRTVNRKGGLLDRFQLTPYDPDADELECKS